LGKLNASSGICVSAGCGVVARRQKIASVSIGGALGKPATTSRFISSPCGILFISIFFINICIDREKFWGFLHYFDFLTFLFFLNILIIYIGKNLFL
jgi:hypothetical protein